MENQIQIVNLLKIYKCLDAIKKRPHVILTVKSITLLENFLSGYLIYAKHNYSNQMYSKGDPDFDEFRWWLNGRGNLPLSTGPRFHQALLKECKNNEEKAFDLFFEKLEEFKKLKSNRVL